jgi:hypothetical protein
MARLTRSLIRGIGAAMALLLLVGIAAPFVHADRYRDRMQSSLSKALGRKVSIDGHVSFSLFLGPALAVDDVKISEVDDSTEPFAYVDEVRAVPRLYSLWTGHLEFSSLTLDGAHVNLVRGGTTDSPSWNFEPLLRPGLLAEFPTIHVRDSRINFVLDGRKSPFYLLGADLDVAPQSSDGPTYHGDWRVRFTGAPARSDRPAHGFGALEAVGTWKRAGDENGVLALDLRLERSEMSDILALLYGRNAGIHGIVSGQAHVGGPMNALGIEGELRVSDLHGWDQSPPSSGVFPFRVSGTLNTPAQHLDLFAQARAGQPQWVLHVSADSYLERPFLKLEFQSDGLPIAPLPGLLRNFGANLPDGLQLTGMVVGSVAFDSRTGWAGNAVIPEATLGFHGSPPLKLEQAAFSISETQITAVPVPVTSGEESIAQASATYSTQDGGLELRLQSNGAPLEAFSQRFPAAFIPYLSRIHSGKWTGQLTYSQPAGAKGAWHGEGELTDASVPVAGVAQPIEMSRAHVRIDADDIQLDHMALLAGGMEVKGDYSFSHGAAIENQFHLTVSRADLSGIEACFHPLLNRGANLIELALGRSSIPKWLSEMKASGTIQVDELNAVAAELSRVRMSVLWDGTRIAFNGLTAHDGPAAVAGVLNIDLKNPKPRYTGSGTWRNLVWRGGSVSGTVTQFETSGMGLETLTNLKMRGELKATDLDLAPLGGIDRMTGSYAVSWSGTLLRVRFPVLRLDGGDGQVWEGSGSAQGTDGEVTLTPSAGKRITLAGSLTDSGKDWVER